MEEPAKSSQTSITVTVGSDEANAAVQPGAPRVRLKLKKPKTGKKVNWTEETVDNEHMDKKKSKCCCIYTKPRAPDESSSSEDDECEHCHGHVEKKKKKEKDTSTPPHEETATTSMVVA